jgi:beta-galactosidase
VYQRYIEKIVAAMAKRYGQHPAVAGWQLDNEPHIHGHYDYSAFAASDFRAWLQRRYGSIDSLNKAWGAAFWSLTYQQFEQIRIPNAKEGFSNPHAILDFQRYTADALAGALRYQAAVLRQHIAPRQWITTNFAYYKFLPAVDLFRSRPDLDFASHTMYLLSTFLNTAGDSMAHRLGSGMELAFSSEMARSIRGYTGIMELQPGQINWGQWNSQPLPGAVRMWIWHSFGLGDLFTCTYRFRQPLYGSEQFHKGIMEPDGVTVAPGGQEYVQAIQEINALPAVANAKMPADAAKRRTAFLWSQDNLLGMEGSKHTNSWDSWQHYYHYYSALKSMGAAVHFLHETDSFDVATYPSMVAPAYEMLDEALVAKLQRYAANGGTLVLSTRTGMKNKHGHLWEALLQQPIWPLIGASVQYYDQLPPGTQSQVQMDGRSYPWQVWADVLKPAAGTNVLASHTQQFYKGQAAVVHRRLGKGHVYYVGVASAGGSLEKAVLQKAWQTAGIPAMQLPAYVFVEWRNGYYVAVNYSATPYNLPLTAKEQVITGSQRLPPGGVTVYRSQ